MGRPDTGIRRFVTKSCPNCGVEFTNKDPYYPEQKFCSHKCFLSSNNRDSARQGAKGSKGGKLKPRNPLSPDLYKKVPGSDVAEHRAVAEQVLGRELLPGEVVHHEDLDKHNNNPSNLIVFPSQAVHMRHHGLKHPGSPCDCPGIRLKEVMPYVQ